MADPGSKNKNSDSNDSSISSSNNSKIVITVVIVVIILMTVLLEIVIMITTSTAGELRMGSSKRFRSLGFFKAAGPYFGHDNCQLLKVQELLRQELNLLC